MIESFVSAMDSIDSAARGRLAKILSKGLVVTTSYSGCGFFEVTLARIFEVLGLAPELLQVYSACDNDPLCQQVLMSHNGPSAAQHVNMDLCERWGQRVTKQLETIQAEYVSQVQALRNHGRRSFRQAVADIGTQMLDAMDAVMARATLRSELRCVKCSAAAGIAAGEEVCCPRKSVVPDGAFTCNAAGSVCVEFSSRGKGAGLTGKTAIVWVCWIWERVQEQEDFIFHECTVRHPTELLMQRYLSKSHITFVFKVCPSLLKLPCTRKRRMAIAISRKFLMRQQPIPQDPMSMFALKGLSLHAGIFFCAPVDEVQAYLKRCLRKRKRCQSNDVAADDDAPLTGDMILATGYLKHLAGYRRWMVDHNLDPALHFSDLHQTCKYSKGPSTSLGCVLIQSKWYSHASGRLLLPMEAFQLMGVPAYRSCADACGWSCPWAVLLESMKDGDVARLAGNGLHVPCVAAVFMWALGILVDVDHL